MTRTCRLAEEISQQAILQAGWLQDLACDFVENELGSNDFHTNWSRLKKDGTAKSRIENWLKAVRATESADSIYQYVEQLHAKGGAWITPYNSRVPAAKKYVPKVPRVRK